MIEITHMNKTFAGKDARVDAVKDVSLTVGDGSVFGVIGYSGAGKSTLVRCINLLEIPESGTLKIGDEEPIVIRSGKLYRGEEGGRPVSARELNSLRRGIGMIFQHFNLLDRSSVFDNVAYPLKYSGMRKGEIAARVFALLDLVDLRAKADAYPSQLSGGQKQRVAIARALANNPKLLLSDEATSALDPDATEAILNLLLDLNRKLGLTIVLITHEMAVIKAVCDRVAVMENGAVVEEGGVYDIFAAPRMPITKKFVSSASALSKIDKLLEEDSPMVRVKPGEKLVRLTFGTDCVGDALISAASRQFNVDMNIVLASVEELRGNALGGMIARFGGTKENTASALEWLAAQHVGTEVLKDGSIH